MADEEKKEIEDIQPEEGGESVPTDSDASENADDAKEPVGEVTDETIDQEIVDPLIGTLKPRHLVEEMQTSYLSYAMSVIVSRALPDVRDGLKPVHRRVLYAMHDIGLKASAKYRKSATVVGEVLGKYHPHGDTAVYDTMVRMAQDFSMRYPLVDGQGNFGSMDGDGAAAMRYTEAKMTKIAEEMLLDIDKDTVDWADNYDGSRQEPLVMPARVPQLLLNGSMGIAVGMATNIPPHNLNELCDGVIHLIDNPEASVDDLMQFIKGPDFPTGGIIYNKEDIKTAYATGKGKIVMRAKADIEEAKRGFRIIITEIPYQVNKATLIERIADLVKEKKIEGISDLRDESDRRGVRVVIELKSSAFPKKVLNRLYELTQMQTAFHVNLLALTPELEPRVMTVPDVLSYYIEHRKEVITRRTKFELGKAKDRAHILEGLKIALDHIDEVINTIRASANRDEAKKNLIAKFSLSEKQADAILEMRLSALAALERQRIEEEYNQLVKFIEYLEDLLANPHKILGLIKEDLNDVKEKYGDARRTEIVPYAIGEFRAEDLIPNQQVIVSLSRGNYIKRQEVDTYRKQIRGGVGVVGMTTKEEDIVDHLACCYSHDDIFFFTNKGRVFKSKVYELPATSRQSKGTPVVNIIQIGPEEKVTSLLTISDKDTTAKYFIMGTKKGVIKRTEIEKYDNIRKTGIIAIGLKDKDELKWVKTSVGEDIIVEVTEKGLAICYKETDVRPMGRSASGVTGMKMRTSDLVMSMDVIPGNLATFEENTSRYTGPDMLIVLENGFGKRTMVKHFHLQKRGGMGIKAANCTPKTGNVIGMHITYSDLGDVVMASKKGQFIRVALKDIKRLGRDTQGVTVMKLREGDKVASVALILPDETDNAPVQESLNLSEPKKNDPAAKKEEASAPKPKEKKEAVESKSPKAPEVSEADKKKVQDLADLQINTYKKEEEAAKPEEDDTNYWGAQ